MAIVIEEGKKRVNWFNLIIISIIIISIGFAIYYLLFAPVPLIEKVSPSEYESIKNISSAGLTPDIIVNNPNFKILRQYINPLDVSTSTISRPNPFLPPR